MCDGGGVGPPPLMVYQSNEDVEEVDGEERGEASPSTGKPKTLPLFPLLIIESCRNVY